MSKLGNHVTLTVRLRSGRRRPAWLYLLAFGLTALIVYGWGQEQGIPTSSKPMHSATAYVVQRAADAGQSEVRIPITCADDAPRRAEEVANARAERWVKEHKADWQRRTEGPYRKAHEAAEQARREHAQNEARFEAFRRHMAETAKAAAEARAVEQRPGASPAPAMVDNPQWLEIQRQLGQLQRRRDSLLIDRTPLHPAVEDVTVQIKDLQRQIATIPRQIPGAASATHETSKSLASPKDAAAATDPVAEQGQNKLNELTVAVETAGRACQRAEAAEKQARNAQRAGPQYAVVYAQAVEIQPMSDQGWRRLMGTTLMAGLLMAFGTGSLSAGAGIEPPVASAAEVQAAAGVPIVATIPAANPLADPRTLARRRTRVRRMFLAIGLILIAAAPMAAIWGVLGI